MPSDTETPLYLKFDREVIYDQDNVRFIPSFLRFDAVLSIAHKFETEISSFPLESGSSISDHALNKQLVIDFTAIVVDSPFSDSKALNIGDEGLVQPLFGVGPVAFSLDSAYNKANNPQRLRGPKKITYPSLSPTPDDFSSLDGGLKTLGRKTANVNLQGGIDFVAGALGLGPDLKPQPGKFSEDPGYGQDPNLARNVVGSVVPINRERSREMFLILQNVRDSNLKFDVITKGKTYNNMVITNLSVNIDSNSGNSLEFVVTCTEMKMITLQKGSSFTDLGSLTGSVGSKGALPAPTPPVEGQTAAAGVPDPARQSRNEAAAAERDRARDEALR